MSGTKIGKYDIVRELGRGAMGIVYEGVDPYIGRKVAIKTIRFDVITGPAEQEEAQQRFMREARSAGNLSHPSIVTIYDVGEDEGLTFIAMEFIEGESLESMIAARKRPALDGVIELIAQIGDALDYAHRRGIVHRDIKPGNILVDKEGRPRIVDFGIARIASSSLTRTNMVLGTPSYMAPEQIAGENVDHRADLFSLGAILYELLTFNKAFPGDNVTTVIYKIMNEEPPPPRDYDQSLPAGLDPIVRIALAKDPAQRYQSGRALSEDLRNHQRFEETEASAAAVEEATAAPVAAAMEPAVPAAGESRRKPLMIAVGAMMAVVVIVVVVLLMFARGDKSAARPEQAGGAAVIPEATTGTTDAGSTPSVVPAQSPKPPVGSTAAPAAGVTTGTAPARPPAPVPRPAQPARPPAQTTPPSRGPADQGSAQLATSGRVFDATEVDERPRVLRQPAPVYPADAARRRIEDVVVVKVLVNANGRADDVQILRRSRYDAAFDAAAVSAVRQWVFAPARKKGQPVSCWFNVGVPFQLPR